MRARAGDQGGARAFVEANRERFAAAVRERLAQGAQVIECQLADAKDAGRAEYVWQGSPGHFICGDQCAFHLSTVVGGYLVSTVGEYRPRGEDEPKPIGVGRLYETMVFVASTCEHHDCDEHHQATGRELDFAAANDRKAARAAHVAMCRKWAAK